MFSGFAAWSVLLIYSAAFEPVNLVEATIGRLDILLNLLLLFFGASTIYSIAAGEVSFGPGVTDGFETMTLLLFNFNYLFILAARIGLIPTEPLSFLTANLNLPYHALYIVPAFAFLKILTFLMD